MACALSALLCYEPARIGHAAESQATSPTPTAVPEYHPSFGDLMTMAVQPRHTKLGLAGQEGNWPYARYELSELRNAFARIARTIPTYQDTDTQVILNAMATPTLDETARAIEAGDARAFREAYAHLTAACNACHVALQHSFVVIQAPTKSAYPDQDFRPRKQP